VEIQIFHRNSLLIGGYDALAGAASFRVCPLVTRKTERTIIFGNVLLAGQGNVAIPTAEMFNVIVVSFGYSILSDEYQLVTSEASGYLQERSKISTAVKFSLVIEVNKIGEQFVTNGTNEATGMPDGVVGFFGSNDDVSSSNAFLALPAILRLRLAEAHLFHGSSEPIDTNGILYDSRRNDGFFGEDGIVQIFRPYNTGIPWSVTAQLCSQSLAVGAWMSNLRIYGRTVARFFIGN